MDKAFDMIRDLVSGLTGNLSWGNRLGVGGGFGFG